MALSNSLHWKDKCWVTTLYLVRDDFKVLLSWNKRMNTWIPIGGHIEPGETPEEALKREVAEETGFDFEFIHAPKKENNGNVTVLKPHRLQIENIPNHGTHINTIFIGKCLSYFDKATTDDNEELRWFSKSELEADQIIIESVKTTALEALEIVSRSV